MCRSRRTIATGSLVEQRPGRVERPRLEDAVALELEIHPAEEPDRGLVVHDEHDRPLTPDVTRPTILPYPGGAPNAFTYCK